MVRIHEEHRSVKIGAKIGKLTVLGACFSLPIERGTKWCCVCECECHAVCVCEVHALERCGRGSKRSCGLCGRIKRGGPITHGLSRHPLYTIRSHMIRRCHNETNDNYRFYGGRGISVCDEWRNSLQAFYKWGIENGWQDGLEIDRIDSNGNYEPSNCRWVTKKVNGNNTRTNHFLTAFGETKTIMQWSEDERCQVAYNTLSARIRKGWNTELAIVSSSRGSSRKIVMR